jgi:hypothetical protein
VINSIECKELRNLGFRKLHNWEVKVSTQDRLDETKGSSDKQRGKGAGSSRKRTLHIVSMSEYPVRAKKE